MRILICLLLPSCVATHVKTPTWSVTRISVLSGHQVPSLTLNRHGDAALIGYEGQPDAKAVQAVTTGITNAIIKP
jgi:hypothetical protein